jgi:hypothetical protein
VLVLWVQVSASASAAFRWEPLGSLWLSVRSGVVSESVLAREQALALAQVLASESEQEPASALETGQAPGSASGPVPVSVPALV